MKLAKSTFPLAFLLVLAPGCATLHQGELPDISVVDLKVADMTLFETTAQFTIRIANPNPEALVVEGGAVRIYLDGIKVGKGLVSERLELPALGTTTVELPIYINHLALATRLQSVLEARELPYRVDSVLWREPTMGYRRKIRSSHEGVFDFQPPEEGAAARPAAGGPAGPPAPTYWRARP